MEAYYNNMILFGIACLNAFTAFIGWRVLQTSNKTQEDLAVVKHETNSMKDALVAATGEAALAKGHAAGLIEGEAKNRREVK